MIERNDFMTNKDFSITELEQKCKELGDQYEDMKKILKEKKQEEENKKQEKLRAEKEVRKKELDEAFENWNKLRKEFIKDYGYYSTSVNESFKDRDSIIETIFGWL